jgi:hypothetical protein
MPIVGPGPLLQWAQKAVGIPPEPSSTVKPRFRRSSTYQAEDRYSRQAVSPNSKIWLVQAERSDFKPSTKAIAACSAIIALQALHSVEWR